MRQDLRNNLILIISQIFKLYIFQVSKMNPDTLKYLQNDQIGKVISKGLANLYTHKPEKPVKYLAQWLKSFSDNQKQFKQLLKDKQNRQHCEKLFNEANNLAAEREALEKRKQEDCRNKIENFKNLIAQHQYQQELLEETLPQFVENHTDITGAYIGELNYPTRQITDEDTDENAHLDTTASQVIKYIGSSQSHKNLMRGQVLALDKGVTGEVFELGQEKEPVKGGQQAEQGQQAKKPEKKKFIYVSNVVKNEKMHYFRIPKLGAYLAVPLIYESYLKQKIFDDALEQKLKYEEELKEFTQKKQTELEDLKVDLEDAEKKVTQLKQKNAEEAQIQEATNELNQVKEKISAKDEQKFEEKEPELTLEKRKYVLCVDNLGKDCQLKEKDIEFIEKLVDHFKNSWQLKEYELLKSDIKTQMNYLKTLSEPWEAIKENYEKELQLDEETVKDIEAIEEQTLKKYKKEQAQFNKLKGLVQEKELIINSFVQLKQFRVVKYMGLIQHILHFLCFSKSQINLPNMTVLDWKNIRAKHINQQTFEKIINYIVQGPKDGNFQPYCTVTHLLKQFQNYNEEEVFDFNFGLGMLLKFIKKALQHRISNIELRRAQKEDEKKKREQIIGENDKIKKEKEEQYEKKKSSLPPEEVEAFENNEKEKWNATYDEEHPLKEQPPAIEDDIDNDL